LHAFSARADKKTRAALRRIVAAHALIQIAMEPPRLSLRHRVREWQRRYVDRTIARGGNTLPAGDDHAGKAFGADGANEFLFAACVMLILAAFAAQARDTVTPPQAPAAAMERGD
jgi:hypothetical protein